MKEATSRESSYSYNGDDRRASRNVTTRYNPPFPVTPPVEPIKTHDHPLQRLALRDRDNLHGFIATRHDLKPPLTRAAIFLSRLYDKLYGCFDRLPNFDIYKFWHARHKNTIAFQIFGC